jgi:hypothetical protein
VSWRRIRAGSGHRYVDDDGEPVDGVTKVIGDGVPKPNLIDAAARETAAYALEHWDDLAGQPLAKRLHAIERGRFETWGRGTIRGTAVHDLAAKLAAGAEVEVPDELLGHVDAYLQFVEQWHVEEIAVEAMVLSRRWHYAGTLDLLAHVDGGGGADGVSLIDWKTGASGVWPETALQLAAYAHAETIVLDDAEQPLPPIAHAYAVHLRADGYSVHPVDVSDETFRSFLYAQQVARFRALPRTATIGDALDPPPSLEVAS